MAKKPLQLFKPETIDKIKKEAEYRAKQGWKMLVLAVAGSTIFLGTFFIYYLFLGIFDEKIIGLTSIGGSVLTKQLLQHYKKGKMIKNESGNDKTN